jgi:hypothetical protein
MGRTEAYVFTTSLFVLSHSAHSLWENCTEFRPERFLENPKPSPFVFTAFQAGPRICLGQNMALLGRADTSFCDSCLTFPYALPSAEMKYVLSYLLQNFELKLAQVVFLSSLSLITSLLSLACGLRDLSLHSHAPHQR